MIPGGESTTMMLGARREGLVEPLRALARDGAARAGLLRGPDHARPRPPRDHGHQRRAQRVRAPDQQLRGRPRPPGLAGEARCTGCSSARRGSPSTGRRSRSSPSSTGTRSRPARATVLAVAFHTELGEDDRVHRLFLSVDARESLARPGSRSRARRRRSWGGPQPARRVGGALRSSAPQPWSSAASASLGGGSAAQAEQPLGAQQIDDDRHVDDEGEHLEHASRG